MLKNIRKYDDNDNDNDDDDDEDDMENLPEIRISLAPAPFPPDRRRLLWSAAPPNRLKSMIGRRDQKIRLKLEESFLRGTSWLDAEKSIKAQAKGQIFGSHPTTTNN